MLAAVYIDGRFALARKSQVDRFPAGGSGSASPVTRPQAGATPAWSTVERFDATPAHAARRFVRESGSAWATTDATVYCSRRDRPGRPGRRGTGPAPTGCGSPTGPAQPHQVRRGAGPPSTFSDQGPRGLMTCPWCVRGTPRLFPAGACEPHRHRVCASGARPEGPGARRLRPAATTSPRLGSHSSPGARLHLPARLRDPRLARGVPGRRGGATWDHAILVIEVTAGQACRTTFPGDEEGRCGAGPELFAKAGMQ